MEQRLQPPDGLFRRECQARTDRPGSAGKYRMMCPDMTVEKNVLAALGQVKKYKQLGKENMALCGSSNRPLIVLQKKEASSKLSDLNGRWIISEAGGQAIPSGMEKQPAIEFDIAEKRMHGNAGCNIINGSFDVDDANPAAISFPRVISTMMHALIWKWKAGS